MTSRIVHIILILSLLILTGCFEEDERIEALPFNYSSIEASIYTNQVFYDLGSEQAVTSNPNNSWVLAFESGPDGWHVFINSSDFWGVQPTSSTSIEDITLPIPDGSWSFDKSDGNPDSTAIGPWLEIDGMDTTYTGEVFILGRYDGIEYEPYYKIALDSVNQENYHFRYANIEANTSMAYSLEKDSSRNRVYFSFEEGGKTVTIEPAKEAWDLLFTQYGTIIPDDFGVLTPYYVRGVLINERYVGVAMDTLNAFESIGIANISQYQFLQSSDAIGYDWKDVEIDEQSNTAVYSVLMDRVYVIRDRDDLYYKLRFIGFYNQDGLKGFPSFEYIRLENN